MNILHAIILGIVEGITEFLPISSTAHIEIAQNLLKIANTEFVKSFTIIIQLGAILAVVIIYWNKIFSSFKYIRNITIAFIPTGVIGFLLYKVIKSFLLGNIYIAATALLIGGLIIVSLEKRNRAVVVQDKGIENLTIKELAILGTAQALAVIPGVSRSGAIIVSGRLLGLPTSLITDFAFLLAIPTMLAATLYDLLKSGGSFAVGDWHALGIGFVVSFVVAYLVAKWLIAYIKGNDFSMFGWYRIFIGCVVILSLF